MRITFVTTKINFERGGGSVPDLDLKVRDMQALGGEVRVVTIFSELNRLPPGLPYKVLEERTVNKSLPALQRNVLTVLKKYERDTDVYHIEGQFSYAGGWYRLRGGKPLIAFYNRELLVWTGGGARHFLRRFIEKLLSRFVVPAIDFLYFTTPQLRQNYFDFGLRVSEERTTTMLDFFDPAAIRSYARTREVHERLQIFASGRMIRAKGFHLLLEALARLPVNLRTTIDLTLSGDGPELENLKSLARKYNIAVRFPGWIRKEDFWHYLSSTDLFVLPRCQLELPSVIVMEALTLGAPTIAPGGGGVEWMAGGAIRTFRIDDVDSLKAALHDLLEDSDERARLSSAGLARVPLIDHLASRERLYDIFRSVVSKERVSV